MSAVRVPETLRKAWGEDVVEAFVPWLDEVLKEKAIPRDEYRQVVTRLDILEKDVSDLKTDVRELRREMNERFDRVNERFDQMYDRMLVQSRWLVGSIALFGTVISILLGIGQFVK